MDKIKEAIGIGHSAPEVDQAELAELKSKYTDAGQGHVFNFWDGLSARERHDLFTQLSSLQDPKTLNQIVDRALNAPKEDESSDASLSPLPPKATASVLDMEENGQTEQLQQYYDLGLDLTAQNQVAVVLMAGGQGTRLGSSDPKGCFDIGLPSHKSLFEIQAQRIHRVEVLAARKAGKAVGEVTVPWYVMTSGPTRGATEKFFEEHSFFGLQRDQVIIFEQGVLPCITKEGKIIMESKGRVAVAPDGNGGIYQALVKSPVMGDMRARGIQHIHAYCVDNCLVRVADPWFIGFSASKQVDIATKVVRKRSANESVGLIMAKNGRPSVVEYSEIDSKTAEAEEPGQPGVLKFRAANIVNHYYSFGYLDTIPTWVDRLPHHVAHKKIPHVDGEGKTVKPESPNGIKLEQFVFDCFPMLDLDRFACLEVRREDEFSPLKNGAGSSEDNAQTSKRDIMLQGRRWLQNAGAVVVGGPEDGVEVSPLLSYAGEDIDSLIQQGQEIKAEAVLSKE